METRREKGVPQEVHLTIQGQETKLHIVDAGRRADIAIEVDDPTSKEQITSAAKSAIEQRYWFTNPEWEHEKLRERFRIELGDHAVEVFAFGEDLSTEVRAEIVKICERFYNHLRDQSLWNLESIQILPKQEVNLKNGDPYRGMEFPAQQRLELYPASMTGEAYRKGELPCTELEGTLVHEMTHIVLEGPLAKVWDSEDLGWKIANDTLIELPGGVRVAHFNTRPQECPTSYGSLQPDDDRADSVVTYLFAPDRLHAKRKEILDQMLGESTNRITASPTPLDCSLPKIPDTLAIRVTQKRHNLFGAPSVISTQEKHIVSLSDFRKEHEIPEPKY